MTFMNVVAFNTSNYYNIQYFCLTDSEYGMLRGCLVLIIHSPTAVSSIVAQVVKKVEARKVLVIIVLEENNTPFLKRWG